MAENEYWSKIKLAFNNETDLSIFKTWNIVHYVPIYSFHQFEESYGPEVSKLISDQVRLRQKDPYIWLKALKEPFDGHTEQSYNHIKRIVNGIEYSPWTLKCAHHLLSYEMYSDKSLNDFEQIVEFGPGIGETCRIACDVGFRGTYYLYDLPEVGRISAYYNRKFSNVKSITSYDEVDPSKKTLFISTWGISEAPFELRNAVFNHFKNADFCIIYQNGVFEYNNDEYFTQEFPKLISVKPKKVHMQFLDAIAGGNYYLIS